MIFIFVFCELATHLDNFQFQQENEKVRPTLSALIVSGCFQSKWLSNKLSLFLSKVVPSVIPKVVSHSKLISYGKPNISRKDDIQHA